ncbi:hypothetical protein [Brevibacillus sp. NRS-1366]|uniref:hypothetical protein n=1 Tax=Brevibacillus sp. NRS-1366 TaxID=3233899 RepID=UPI003D1B932B
MRNYFNYEKRGKFTRFFWVSGRSGCGGEEEKGENAPASWDTGLGGIPAQFHGKSETASKVAVSGGFSEVDA